MAPSIYKRLLHVLVHFIFTKSSPKVKCKMTTFPFCLSKTNRFTFLFCWIFECEKGRESQSWASFHGHMGTTHIELSVRSEATIHILHFIWIIRSTAPLFLCRRDHRASTFEAYLQQSLIYCHLQLWFWVELQFLKQIVAN